MKKINIIILLAISIWQFACKCERILTCQDGNQVVVRSQKCINKYYLTIATERENKFKGAIDILDKIKIMELDVQTKKNIVELRTTLDQQRSGSQDIIKGAIFGYNGRPCDPEASKRYFDVMDKLAKDNAASSQIQNDLALVVNQQPDAVKNSFNKAYNNYNKTKVDASQKAIQALESEPPTNGLMLQAFWGYEFDGNKETSFDEAKKMLKYLGAVEIQKNLGCGCYEGRLLSDYYVLVWLDTYGKKDTYGIRYGKKEKGGFPFIGHNDTYIEIEKQ